MKTYFNIRYEFDREAALESIRSRVPQPGSDYVCVADGVILNTANRFDDYLRVINGGMFCICDSSFVPLYIRWIHGLHYEQYTGSQIFRDVITARNHRMIFLGTKRQILDCLQAKLTEMNPDVANMQFIELPFCSVDEFDYQAIADTIERDGADIVWVALGAPKQEYFMARLKPHLHHGVMIAVGAAFKFYSGTEISRAPQWMVRNHLEFVHRIFKEPRKQLHRCYDIVRTLPGLLYNEYKAKQTNRIYEEV